MGQASSPPSPPTQGSLCACSLHPAFEALQPSVLPFLSLPPSVGAPPPLQPVLSHPLPGAFPGAVLAAHHRAGAVWLWAPLEGTIPTPHVVLTAPWRLVKALGAMGPPQQLWTGRAWHGSRLGWAGIPGPTGA